MSFVPVSLKAFEELLEGLGTEEKGTYAERCKSIDDQYQRTLTEATTRRTQDHKVAYEIFTGKRAVTWNNLKEALIPEVIFIINLLHITREDFYDFWNILSEERKELLLKKHTGGN